MRQLATAVYRMMEMMDGERGFKLLMYRFAEMVKVYCLRFI
jgi:hypothetical protein